MIITLDSIIKDFNLKITGVIHIGAHTGEEFKDYARHGIEDMIFFEPIKSNFQELMNILPKDEHIRAYNFALGDKVGRVEMFVETANKGQSCSVLEPGTHLNLYPHIQFPTKETVFMERLDNIPIQSSFNMINIDVQGYELEVFKGATDTLKHIDIVYTEVNTEEVYKGCALMSQIDDFLRAFGFIRVIASFPYGKAWGDALYLKR